MGGEGKGGERGREGMISPYESTFASGAHGVSWTLDCTNEYCVQAKHNEERADRSIKQQQTSRHPILSV